MKAANTPAQKNWDEVISHLQSTKKANQILGSQVIIITSLIFVGFIIFLKHSLTQPLVQPIPSQENLIMQEEALAPTRSPVLGSSDQAQPTPAPLVYYLTVSAKPPVATLSSLFLSDTLVDALDLPFYPNKPYPLKAITVESSGGNPHESTLAKFNHSYYVVAQNPDAINKSYYESDLVRVTARAADKELLPYLLNNRYCQSDTDCTLRNSYCDQGSFNRFDPFLDTFSCLNTTTSNYSPQLKCFTHQAFSNSRCVSQKCTADVTQVCNTN